MAGPILAALRDEAETWLADEQVPGADRRIETTALMRYAGQGSELPVAWTADPLALSDAFAAAHEALYGFRLAAPIELVTVRVEASGRLAHPVPHVLPDAGGSPGCRETVMQLASGEAAVPVLARSELPAGFTRDGPMIVTQVDATTVVPEGWSLAVHASAALLLRRFPAGAAGDGVGLGLGLPYIAR